MRGSKASRNSVGARLVLASLVLLSAGASLGAEVIRFPDEELASESVLPVFDRPTSVLNKNINIARRLELGVSGGLSLLEPFYNPYSLSAVGAYNFSDLHSVEVLGTYFMQGLSSNGQGLNPIPNKTPATNANLQYAPAPKYMLLGNYRFTGFYGKLSLGKNFIMHLNVYGLGGGGMIQVGDGMFPIANVGIGQKLYFSNSFALKIDFRFMAYQGPDVLSKALDTTTSAKPASHFSTKMNYLSLLNVGAVFLF